MYINTMEELEAVMLNHEQSKRVETENSQHGMVGWVCPNCKRGMSPFQNSCGCVTKPFVVTC